MTRVRTGLSLLLLVAILSAPASAEERINWAPSLQAAINMASRQNQLVLLHFWAPGCMPCRRLDKNVFSRQDVADFVDQHYVPVKINASVMPDTARRYKVDRWPMDVIITPAGYTVHSMVSPQDPQEYVNVLNQIAAKRNPSGGRAIAGLGTPQGIQNAANAIGSQAQQTVDNVQDRFRQTSQQTQDRFDDAVQGARSAAGEARDRFNSAATQTRGHYDNISREVGQGAAAWQDAVADTAAQFGGAGRSEDRWQEQPQQRPDARFASNGQQNQSNPYVDPRSQAEQRAPSGPAPQGVQSNPHMNQPPSAPAMSPQQPRQEAAMSAPVGNPPLGLQGHCPVTLLGSTKWEKGDPRYGIIHRGRTYLFVSENAKKQFWTDPDRYAPILSGNDPVIFADSGRLVTGTRSHGVFFRSQIYLFSSEDSLRQFWDAPQRYADHARQAMQRSTNRARR